MARRFYEYVGWLTKYQNFKMSEAALKKLKKGKNVFAIHVENTGGGAWVDIGLVNEKQLKKENALVVAEQKDVTITATQTIYELTCEKGRCYPHLHVATIDE